MVASSLCRQYLGETFLVCGCEYKRSRDVEIYDYFLTLDAEIALIWSSHFGFMNSLFIATRYAPFANITLVLYCTSIQIFLLALGLLTSL